MTGSFTVEPAGRSFMVSANLLGHPVTLYADSALTDAFPTPAAISTTTMFYAPQLATGTLGLDVAYDDGRSGPGPLVAVYIGDVTNGQTVAPDLSYPRP